MKEIVNKILNEILSGADGFRYVAVLIIAYPVMVAWLLYKAVNRNPDPKTGELSKFSLWYAIRHNLPVVIYTSIFINVSAIWATSNFPTYKAITLGIALGILSTSLGIIFDKLHTQLFKKTTSTIEKI